VHLARDDPGNDAQINLGFDLADFFDHGRAVRNEVLAQGRDECIAELVAIARWPALRIAGLPRLPWLPKRLFCHGAIPLQTAEPMRRGSRNGASLNATSGPIPKLGIFLDDLIGIALGPLRERHGSSLAMKGGRTDNARSGSCVLCAGLGAAPK